MCQSADANKFVDVEFCYNSISSILEVCASENLYMLFILVFNPNAAVNTLGIHIILFVWNDLFGKFCLVS